jgi:hypothetical protein
MSVLKVTSVMSWFDGFVDGVERYESIVFIYPKPSSCTCRKVYLIGAILMLTSKYFMRGSLKRLSWIYYDGAVDDDDYDDHLASRIFPNASTRSGEPEWNHCTGWC